MARGEGLGSLNAGLFKGVPIRFRLVRLRVGLGGSQTLGMRTVGL